MLTYPEFSESNPRSNRKEFCMRRLILAFLLLLSPLSLLAHTPPAGGESLFAKPGLESLQWDGVRWKMEKVEVTGQAFKEAVKLTTFTATQNPWNVQVEAPVALAVKTGDVVLAEFWMRAAETNVE